MTCEWGTVYGYRKGCRCQDCRTSHAAYQREWRRRQSTTYDNLPTAPSMDLGWMDRAACRHESTDLFYSGGRKFHRAVAICQQCPVRQQCLNYAVATEQPQGVWGGLTPEQRNNLRRQTA